MRQVDGILDFLEEYGLLGVPAETGGTGGRIGDSVGSNEEIFEVDWEALTITGLTITGLTDTAAPIDDPVWDADILGGLGRGQDRQQERQIRDIALPAPWDSCAWYAPIHYYGPSWGIYIRQDCLLDLAIEIGWFAWDSPNTAQTARDLKQAAFFALFLHEHFHHKLEGFGIRLELADRAAPGRYRTFDAAAYQPTIGTDDNLEEALANADAYIRLAHEPYSRVLPSGIRAATRWWMKWRFRYIEPPRIPNGQGVLVRRDLQCWRRIGADPGLGGYINSKVESGALAGRPAHASLSIPDFFGHLSNYPYWVHPGGSNSRKAIHGFSQKRATVAQT